MSCTATNSCVAVGAGGTIRAWNGTSWGAQPSGTTQTLSSVSCTATNSCVAVGNTGTIRGWNGISWSAQPSGTTQQLRGVSCTATNSCVAVGNTGTRLGALPLTLTDTAAAFSLDLDQLSCLTALSVTEVSGNHPNAGPALQTGRYWQITPTPASCASNYRGTLTLPYAPLDVNDKVCRYTGTGQLWSCVRSSNTATTVTRSTITQFSDWAVGNNAGPTPVTLTSLEAVLAVGGVELRWRTASELDVVGYQLLRSPSGQRAEAVPVSPLLPATGDGVMGGRYSWLDAAPLAGGAYWLQVLNRDGTPEEYGPVQPAPPTPAEGTLRLFLPTVRQ